MKKLALILAISIFTNLLFGGTLRIEIKNTPDNLFEQFAKELENYAKNHYRIDNFKIDRMTKTIKGERVFKVKKRRKNNLLIGTPKDNFKKRPKWKKEKIEITGTISKNQACIDVTLVAYNKRTRKWHKLQSDYLLEEHMGAFLLSLTFKGKNLWSIGNVVVEENEVSKKILNLTKLQLESVDVSIDPATGIKSVNFNLKKDSNILTYKVLMVGDIKNLNDALKIFNSHFLDYNPIKKVSRIYKFYWAYAKHGEIMDGMHRLQVITALGFPEKIVKNKDKSEVFVYNFDGNIQKYTIVNNELLLQ